MNNTDVYSGATHGYADATTVLLSEESNGIPAGISNWFGSILAWAPVAMGDVVYAPYMNVSGFSMYEDVYGILESELAIDAMTDNLFTILPDEEHEIGGNCSILGSIGLMYQSHEFAIGHVASRVGGWEVYYGVNMGVTEIMVDSPAEPALDPEVFFGLDSDGIAAFETTESTTIGSTFEMNTRMYHAEYMSYLDINSSGYAISASKVQSNTTGIAAENTLIQGEITPP
ncbi:MAG: hypothetical protein DWH91_04785 [Planctomycetota bacterium]|nr:MAG: hypothetical protein DWH91_04785 [Planctomycetota bacterium]